MPIPKLLVANFYQLTLNRDFAQAERSLKEVRGKLTNVKWNEGYLHALEGMLTAQRGKNDRYALMNQVQNEKENIVDLMEDFRRRSRDLICVEFDRGFFTAWADFTYYLALKEGMISKKSKRSEKQGEGEMKIQPPVNEKAEVVVEVKGEVGGESVRQTVLNLHGALEEGKEEYPESKPGQEEG